MRLPTFAFPWFLRLTRREQVLTLLVAGALFVVLNLLAISFLVNAYGSLTRQYDAGRLDLLRQKVLASQQAMWTQRGDWLKATQPVLVDRARAGTALYEQVQTLARANQIVVTALQINPAGSVLNSSVDKGPDAPQGVTVTADTQGDWKETVHFLTAIQRPDSFLVFDLAKLDANPADPKQMKGHFVISKWYVPAVK